MDFFQPITSLYMYNKGSTVVVRASEWTSWCLTLGPLLWMANQLEQEGWLPVQPAGEAGRFHSRSGGVSQSVQPVSNSHSQGLFSNFNEGFCSLQTWVSILLEKQRLFPNFGSPSVWKTGVSRDSCRREVISETQAPHRKETVLLHYIMQYFLVSFPKLKNI